MLLQIDSVGLLLSPHHEDGSLPGGSQVADCAVGVRADIHGVGGQLSVAQQVLQRAVGGAPSCPWEFFDVTVLLEIGEVTEAGIIAWLAPASCVRRPT